MQACRQRRRGLAVAASRHHGGRRRPTGPGPSRSCAVRRRHQHRPPDARHRGGNGQTGSNSWWRTVGATGNIGAAAVAKAAPDGYTLLLATLGPWSPTSSCTKRRLRLPLTFAPIVLLGSSPLTIVEPELPVQNLAALIAHAGQAGHAQRRHDRYRLAGPYHAGAAQQLAGMSIATCPGWARRPADLISGDLRVGFSYIPTRAGGTGGTVLHIAVTSLGGPGSADVPTRMIRISRLRPGWNAAGTGRHAAWSSTISTGS